MIVLLEKLMLALKAMEALIEQKISTLQDTIEGKLSAVSDKIVNPDWNQNDATAADYIENRPFYKVSEGKTIVETQIVDLYAGQLEGISFTHDGTIKIGDQITVIWNDTTYDLTVGEHLYNGEPSVGYYVDRDESYPFTISFMSDGNIFVDGRNGSETINFGIMVPGEYVKIPSEYLPEIEIPEVKQPDWNENDASQSSHILNRPCYKTDGDYLFEPVTLTFEEGSAVPNESHDLSFINLDGTKDFQWNNKIYSIVASWSYWGEQYYCNTPADCPFNVNVDGGNADIQNITRKNTTSYEEVTFAIGNSLPRYIQLDEGYIPDTIARKSDIASTEGFVKYTEQTLTEEQQMQTRENLGLYYTKDGVNYTINDWYIPDNIARFSDILQSDWTQEDESTKDFIKNKPRIGQDYIILTDIENSYDYVIYMKNGNLVSSLQIANIKVTSMPEKTDYMAGDPFDPTGMEVVIIYQDGSQKIINDYTYSLTIPNIEGTIDFEISYNSIEKTYSDTISLSVTAFDPSVQLIDFKYTENSNGTYTLTAWKETLNGEPSTEMIIPNSSLIVL